MLLKQKTQIRKFEKGFSLIELMISITVGMIITASIGHLFGQTIKLNSSALVMTRLNQDLRATMSIMTSDMRRAGYWGQSETGIAGGALNPFTQGSNELTVSELAGEAANSCVTYAYDYNDDGIVDNAEKRGFRLNNGVLEMAVQDADCSTNIDWEPVFDPNVITITGITFTPNFQSIDIDGDSNADMIIKDVEVILTGQLVADSGVNRTLLETVRVRNESIIQC
jgi:prepilin-type N-terminal cleavage/methylation domain-containing protein